MRISVIGCGYLGAVHAASMTHLGHDVVGIDLDESKVAALSNGHAPFFEPGLPELLAEGIASGRLRFTTEMSGLDDAVVHFIAVGTPQQAGGQSADMRYLDSALESMLPRLRPGSLVVGKSTVPVGTAARVFGSLPSGIDLVWNPEFLREGFAVQDTISPDRFVYGVDGGTDDSRAVRLLDEVYSRSIASGVPRIVTDFATSELVKVAANAFLATKVSFINAMAEIAEVTGADVTQLADAIGHDARIGRRFLNSGIGFGGGCLPKDIRAFMARADELGVGSSLAFLREVDAINLRRRDRLVDLVTTALGGSVSGRRIGVLGLAFKPNSDDVRDSPALDIAARLQAAGAIVTATDPEAIATSRRLHPELAFVHSAEQAVRDAEIVLVLTEWSVFRELDPRAVLDLAAGATVVDGRNCLDADAWRAAGWRYIALGRPERERSGHPPLALDNEATAV